MYIDGSPGDFGSSWYDELELTVTGRAERGGRGGGCESRETLEVGALCGGGGFWNGRGGDTGPDGMLMVG